MCFFEIERKFSSDLRRLLHKFPDGLKENELQSAWTHNLQNEFPFKNIDDFEHHILRTNGLDCKVEYDHFGARLFSPFTMNKYSAVVITKK